MKLSAFSVASTIVGAFIGAGFASGQELWQFFGKYGAWGLAGFAIAILTIVLLSYAVISFAQKTHARTFPDVIIPNGSPKAKKALHTLEVFFYLSFHVIMTAGIQSLATDYTDFNEIYVGALYCVVVLIISLLGLKGLVSAFSATIPMLVVIVVINAVCIISAKGIPIMSQVDTSTSLSQNWLFSSLIYVSYNFFSAIGIFASLGYSVESKKTIKRAVPLSVIILLFIGGAVILSISGGNAYTHELPMLTASRQLGGVFGAIYAFLLVLAMLGASLTAFFPITEWFRTVYPEKKKARLFYYALFSALTLLLSRIGFSDLISTIYPAFGYVGFIFITAIIFNVIRIKK